MSNFRHIKVTQTLKESILILEENRFVQVPDGMSKEQEQDYIFDEIYKNDVPLEWDKLRSANPKLVELDWWDVDTDWEYIDKKDTQS